MTFHARITQERPYLLFQLDFFGHETRNIAAILENVADDARRNAYQFAFGEQENGLQLGMKAFVGVADHVLVLEIAAATQAADDEFCSDFLAEICRQAFVGLDFHLWIVLENVLNPLDAVFQRECAAFFAVDADGDVKFIEQRQGSQNDGAMA